MKFLAALAPLLWSSTLVACGSKGSVALTAAIDSPMVAVSSLPAGALQVNLTGGFSLYLELGAYAPSGTDIPSGQGNFSLVQPSDQSTLVVLDLTSVPPRPYHLEPGTKQTIALTIDAQGTMPGQLIPKKTRDAICPLKTVQIAGSMTDTASGNPTPVTSNTFDVMGCM